MFGGLIPITEQVTAATVKINGHYQGWTFSFYICNKYKVHDKLSLAIKATNMHYEIHNITQKNGNAQLKVYELQNHCQTKRLLLFQKQEYFEALVTEGC
jgi:hypothetical protein